MRRFAIPLALSLTVHAVLLTLFGSLWLVLPSTQRPQPTSFGGSLSLSIASLPRPRGTPRRENEDVIPVSVEPILTPTRHADSGSPAALAAGPPTEGSGGPGIGLAGAPGSSVLPVPPRIRRVVYLIDRSVSTYAVLPRARRELALSLRALPTGTLFQVLAYNRTVTPLLPAPSGLASAAEVTVAQTIAALENLPSGGGTDHVGALKRGLALRPEILFWLTDADDLPDADVAALTRLNHGTILHVVELSSLDGERGNSPLARLAAANGGTHRRVHPRR